MTEPNTTALIVISCIMLLIAAIIVFCLFLARRPPVDEHETNAGECDSMTPRSPVKKPKRKMVTLL